MMSNTHNEIEYIKLTGETPEPQFAQIAIEAEASLTVNGETWLGFRCSPDNLEYLAAGFLYNESFIDSANEIESIQICQVLNMDVWLNHACPKPEYWNRTSGCSGGVSRKTPNDSNRQVAGNPYQSYEILNQIKIFLSEISQMGEKRSGVHTTLLLDGLNVVSISNDIGRHNTLDKIAGDCLINKKRPAKPVLLSTGRISSDMVLKAERMGVGLVISLHSISSLAIEAGTKTGIVLIGHARSSKLSVYTHPEWIIP